VSVDGVTVSGPVGVKPTISLSNDPPPTSLVIKDVAVGTGAAAEANRGAVVQYVGISWTTKRQFDASWDRGQPLPFALGVGQVIAGWDQGVAGMKVGGRRLLIIPPDLGYGPSGQPPAIAPNDTLVFVVDLVGVQ
jgi:peptidylprolyl isomerase